MEEYDPEEEKVRLALYKAAKESQIITEKNWRKLQNSKSLDYELN